MSSHSPTVTVAVLCGDPIVGKIVGNLLQTVGYEARPVADIAPEELSTVALLLIAPGSDPEEEAPPFEEAGVPMLDLSGSSWPCRIEEIKASIETALSGKVAEVATELAAELEPEPG